MSDDRRTDGGTAEETTLVTTTTVVADPALMTVDSPSRAGVTFFPAVRRGFRPDGTFDPSSASVADPGQTAVELDVTGEGEAGTDTRRVSTTVSVYGPGEVTGIDHRQVVRVEPEPDTDAFPPNYFPLVEFDRADLPWLFSPERADAAGRNRPWLTLVCVPVDDQAVRFSPAGTGPCPVLEAPTSELPDPKQSWAWAHAQLLGRLDDEDELDGRSNRTLSRLVCPRNLTPNTRYRACVVPTFEPGRRAGLGLEPYPDGRGSMAFAWGDEDSVRLPVYYTWEFTSAEAGDFESLVRELVPRELGPEVGQRTVDVSNPGPEELKLPFDGDTGTVGLAGALRSVTARPDPYDADARATLRDVLNAPADVADATDFGAVGPPLYGQWHAGIDELEPEPEGALYADDYYYPTWFNDLNADPRHRVAAGFGTKVVQREQERLMASAWEQFGDVQAANRALRAAQLARDAMESVHARLDGYSTPALLGVSAPIHGRIFDEDAGETVLANFAKSDAADALASTSFRRLTSTTGPLARRTGVDVDPTRLGALFETGAVPHLGDGLAFDVVADLPATEGADASSTVGGTSLPATSEGGDSQTADGSTLPTLDGANVPSLGGTNLPTTGGTNLPTTGGTNLPDTGDAGAPGPGEYRPMSYESGAPFPGPQPPADPSPAKDAAFAALASLERHVLAAEDAVADLATAVGRDDAATVDRHLAGTPTVEERCESIGLNTFPSVARSLAKLQAAATDAGEAPAVTAADRRDVLRELHRQHRRLTRLVGEATAALREGSATPKAVERHLDRAQSATAALLAEVDRVRTMLAAPPMELQSTTMAMSAEAPVTLDASSLVAGTPMTLELPSFDAVRTAVLDELDPEPAIAAHLGSRLRLPLFDRDDPVEEVLAAPSFPEPTYELLADLDQEYFLPGVGEIPNHSVGVLETNPEFVEAFLAGLNHELSRELRWRRYPTDRKGTYFRRFWDRTTDPEARRRYDAGETDALDDVTPMHTWDENDLGENNPNGEGATVVLLVKGELLRRYPNTDVFAAKAVDDEGDRVPALPHSHVSRDDEGEDVKFPVFRGRLAPDVTFFGFDLTTDEALYDPYHREDTKDPDDHPDEGWFFVLQEPPAETRFGLDVNQGDVGATPPGVTHPGTVEAGGTTETVSKTDAEAGPERGWAALSWGHLVADGEDPASATHVDVETHRPGAEGWVVEDGTSWVTGVADEDDAPTVRDPVFDDEDAAAWGRNSAHMARITWQRPVRVSIHADDMLSEEEKSRATELVDLRMQGVDVDAETYSMSEVYYDIDGEDGEGR